MLSNLGPNISVLRELGVRNTCIVSLLMGPRASVLFFESEKFKENVEKVVGMGFDLLMSSFTGSLAVISTIEYI
ncbi:hypothetical protein L484_020493 [Morus notabilis]|uniref:Uncharacterized protein n=1 Tax=Morus notabilis TaxID=981085 RepID=W9SLZ0_9ROSA|nr:hypothetical protein L484_020493 [Morus notabilis]